SEEFARVAIGAAVFADVLTVTVGPDRLRAIVSDMILQGAPSGEWWSRQSQALQRRFADRLRLGLIQNETTQQIVRGIREEVMPGAGRGLTALVQTSIAWVSNQAMIATFEANADLIQAVQHRSTLDERTSDICIAYSGKIWKLPDYQPVGHSLPWNGGAPRHWRCRSINVPVLQSFADLAGGDDEEVSRSRFEAKLRRSGFSAKEARAAASNAQASLTGTVSEDLNFEEWLRNQPKSRQVAALGPTRWELWDKGKISLSDLVDQTGRPLTLAQLQARIRRRGR
ncbi:MAG: phage minor head protein, partial [bacterium]